MTANLPSYHAPDCHLLHMWRTFTPLAGKIAGFADNFE
jgi:hypothetical protein